MIEMITPKIAIPSARPTKIIVRPKIDWSSEIAPSAAEPTLPTANPVPIVARPVDNAAPMYFSPSALFAAVPAAPAAADAVSYTHLTLPTILLV